MAFIRIDSLYTGVGRLLGGGGYGGSSKGPLVKSCGVTVGLEPN